MNKYFIIALFFLLLQTGSAQTEIETAQPLQDTSITSSYVYRINDSLYFTYNPTKRLEFAKNALVDIYLAPAELVKKKNIKGLAWVAVTTAIFIYYDQELLDAAKQFGRFIGLSAENNTYNLTGSKDFRINVPTDLSSGLYYLGDGITELAVNAGFYIYGLATDDKRALQTAAQLAEGMIAVGSWVQILKHLSGHESPDYSSVPAGRWRFFPNIADYQKHVPKYDAFPSGHLATAMMSTTVISMNYPEYKFIKPLCFTLMGLCGYQMMNNGVHWMGDYPLAIAMGYSIGKMAVDRGRSVTSVKKKSFAGWDPHKSNYHFELKPAILGAGASGLAFAINF